MSRPTKVPKLEREVKSISDKASDEFNLTIAIKMERELIKTFKDSLRGLRTIIEEIEKYKIIQD